MVYLSIDEKKTLALKGNDIPICVGKNACKNLFIVKLRGTIFANSLKNKKFCI